MAYLSPLEELHASTVVRMTALGSSLLHLFGEREAAQHTTVNRYVWVPTRIATDSDNMSANAEGRRTLFPVRHECEVRCWGQSREVVYAMVTNLVKALNDVTQADLVLDGASWDPDDGHTDFGVLMTVEFALRGVFADEWTPIAPYTGAVQALTGQGSPGINPGSVSFASHMGPDTDSDYEEIASDVAIA